MWKESFFSEMDTINIFIFILYFTKFLLTEN